MIAVVGGSKVSTKLEVLDRLAEIADTIIVGGGIANTFIAAQGQASANRCTKPISSMPRAESPKKCDVPLPFDVVTAPNLDAAAKATLRRVDAVRPDEMILDIGPETARAFAKRIAGAGTILWNGPVGVFEFDQFGEGTRVIAHAIATSPGFSIAGGGDTLAAIDKYGVGDRISYISTGGGAFLEFVEGKQLPAVEVLEARAKR